MSQAQQQALPLTIPSRFSYGDWVRHAGVEDAANRLALWLVHGGRIWLTSQAVSGKSHLLRLLKAEHRNLGLLSLPSASQAPSLALVQQWLRQLEPHAHWAVDVPAGRLPVNLGLALFHLLERAREQHRPLVIAWRPASESDAPPELMSRLKGSMEHLECRPPATERELKAVLASVAASLQWQMDTRAMDALLERLPRRLEALVPAMIRLERLSLANRRKRLSRQWIADQLDAISAQA